MLRSLKELDKYGVSATDGDLGTVVDFLFDDERWAVRYLVVETRFFLAGHRVLISPAFFDHVDWGMRRFHVAMTKDKVRDSPSVDLHQPISRQHEREYYGYYGYPYYWGYSGLWGTAKTPALLGPTKASGSAPAPSAAAPNDSHLRSAKEVVRYSIRGAEGTLGHVADIIGDEETWAVRYFVLATSHLWWGKKVLVAPEWASGIDWLAESVTMDVSRKQVQEAPAWDGIASVNRPYEDQLYHYYGRETYWGEGTLDHSARKPGPP